MAIMQANRFFNNSGPVNELDHFCVAPIKRLDTNKVWQLILQKKYFLICGPKQCGKTSYLLSLANVINHNKSAKCLYFNVESLRGVKENLEESIRSILFEISSRARDTFGDEYLEDLVTGILEKRGPYQALNELLTQWSKRSDRPIVLLIDEIDTLEGAVLTSVLSQIRAGYDKRPALFPLSIVFCATHDVIEKQFNIKDASLRISFLRREDLDSMYSAYTAKHGVEIDKAAIDRIWKYSAGQPWIISTLSGEIFHEIVPAKGIRRVSAEQVDEAIGNIIVKKGNHLEYLVSQLRDERVKKCLIPILTSGSLPENMAEGDFAFVRELGLIRTEGKVELSNGLYKEMVPGALFGLVTYMINLDAEDFLREDGSIDTVKLLRSFQAFFRNHIDRMIMLLDYGLAGYILVFEALLNKLADSTNFISYEYGVDQGRVVLRLKRVYPERQDATFILKLAKVWSLEKYKQMLPRLLEESEECARAGDGGEVHAVVINVNPEFDWEGKLPYTRKGTERKPVHLWGF
jgi:hypothetical protein